MLICWIHVSQYSTHDCQRVSESALAAYTRQCSETIKSAVDLLDQWAGDCSLSRAYLVDLAERLAFLNAFSFAVRPPQSVEAGTRQR